MKKIILALLIFNVTITFAQEGKIRSYTVAELKRWSTVCEGISKPLPKVYNNYQASYPNCGGFAWSERDTKGNPLTVTNLKDQPTGNRPYFDIYFKMDEELADTLDKNITALLLEGRKSDGSLDPKKVAEVSIITDKFNQCKNPYIRIAINQNVAIQKVYEAGTRPVKLSLPVACFAFLYTVPEGKLMGNDKDEISYDNTSQYLDKALIIISTGPPKVTASNVAAGASMKEEIITPTDGCEQSLLPVKNIVVEINGYEKDVRALINKIDWKALQLLLNK